MDSLMQRSQSQNICRWTRRRCRPLPIPIHGRDIIGKIVYHLFPDVCRRYQHVVVGDISYGFLVTVVISPVGFLNETSLRRIDVENGLHHNNGTIVRILDKDWVTTHSTQKPEDKRKDNRSTTNNHVFQYVHKTHKHIVEGTSLYGIISTIPNKCIVREAYNISWRAN